jgi:hypothetical protein
VLVVLILAIIAILVGVFAVSTGRGGEMAYEQADHAPLDLGPLSPTDIALLRPPTALWGYNMQVTDDALDRIARAMRDRDIEVAYLRRQLGDLGHLERAGQAGAGTHEGEALAEEDEAPRQFTPKHEAPRTRSDETDSPLTGAMPPAAAQRAGVMTTEPAADTRAEPASAKPAAADTAALYTPAESAAAKSAAVEPAVTEPAVTERAVVEPTAAKPAAAAETDASSAVPGTETQPGADPFAAAEEEAW